MEKLVFKLTIEKEREMEIYTVKGMDFSEEEIEKAWAEDKPLQIGLAFPRRICNANCPYCYTAESKYTSKKEDRAMSVEQILNSLEEAKEMGCKQVMIGGYGEPLLNDEFWPVLEKGQRNWSVCNGFFQRYAYQQGNSTKAQGLPNFIYGKNE